MAGRAAVPAVLALLAVTLGCPARPPRELPGTLPAEFGVYRATYHELGRSARSFRVWLYAARPDRLHAELLPPVGGPAVIVDAGGGRVAVTVTREGTTWIGESGRDAMERVFGFPVGVGDLVGGLLDGATSPGPVAMIRTPARGAGLPRRFRLEWEGRSLALDLRKRRALDPARTLAVGTGAPPAGMEVVPLERLAEGAGGPVLLPED